MTTVSCTVMTGGSQMDRATINKQQFVEATGMVGSGVVDDVKVGTAKEVIIVDGWTPEAESKDVDHGHSIKVDLHATDDTAELEHLFDEGQDFIDNGVNDDTEIVGDLVQLAVDSELIDFEDYLVGNITQGGNPHSWTSVSPNDNSYPIEDPFDSENTCVKTLYWGDWTGVRLDDAGGANEAGVIELRLNFEKTGDQGFLVCHGLTGSGSALRGHAILINTDSNCGYVRFIDYNSVSNIRWQSLGFTPAISTWYRVKVAFGTNLGVNTWASIKMWEDGEAEPENYTWVGTDTAYAQAGYVGIVGKHKSSNPTFWWDDFRFSPSPAVYVASGEYTSNELDTRTVKHYSHGLITWDETIPTDTTVAVKSRWRPWDAWAACTNGGEIPGIERGANTEDGSPYENLEFQIALATTDNSATPTVGNLRIYFEPLSSEALLLDLDGDFECIVEDGSLDYWGRSQVDTGAAVLAWDDIHIQSNIGRWVVGRGAGLVLTLKYGGVTIDDIVIYSARDYWMESPDFAGYYWGMTPLVYEAAPIQARYNVQEPWTPGSHIYEWVLVDKNIAMHADTWWIVGHVQLDDTPGMLISGVAQRSNYPGSMLAKAHRIDDSVGHALVQGWRFDNIPGMVMPAVQFWNDNPGAVLTGVRQISDQPGMVLVYGVNRDGAIFVNVVDDDTYQALLDAGITFS